MANFESALSTNTPLGVGGWTSSDVIMTNTAVVGVSVSSDNNLTLNFNWSSDGISNLLTESESVIGGTPDTFYRSVKAKYLSLELVNGGGTNTALDLQSFFFDLASAGLTIRNLGSGEKILNLPALGVKSLTSTDASVTFTTTDTEIDLSAGVVTLSSAGGTYSLVNDGTSPTLANKGLNAGTNITITDNGTNLSIASSATASNNYFIMSSPITSFQARKYWCYGLADSSFSSANMGNILLAKNGTLANLRTKLSGTHTADISITVYVNNVATAITCTITAGNTTASDLVNTLAVVVGDRFCFSCTSASGTIQYLNASIEY